MICNYNRNQANNALAAPTVPTNSVATSLTSFNPQPPLSKTPVRAVTNFDYGIEHGESSLYFQDNTRPLLGSLCPQACPLLS